VHIFGYRDPVGLVGAMAATRASVPYLIEPCGMVRPKVRSFLAKRAFDAAIGKRVLERAAIIVATSKLERRELLEEGVDRNRIRIRPNGITLPPSDAHRDDFIRKRFGVPMEAPLVLTIGRIARVKGLFDLVESVSRLPGAHLLIAGPDARDGTLPALVRRTSGLGGRVHIDPEGLWGRDKLQAFGDADCFALPSQTENFGNAAAEAATAGLPVVVSDECGVAEVLDPAAHRVIRVGDVGALTAAIAELIRGDGPRRAAASAALKLRELLDWSSLVAVQLEIYREVLSGTGIGRPTT
jgi:glycosyltransferase involved in cell wall biosynthesis